VLGWITFSKMDPIVGLYADDTLLLAPTVTALEKLLHACECEHTWLDMLINCKKSFCLRVGQRCDAVCANEVNYCGQSISWVQR